MKKRYVIGAVVIILVLVLVVIQRMNKTSENDTDEKNFFEVNNQEYIKNMIVNNNETIHYDGYSITLEKSIYDKTTRVAYCVFGITQDDGKTNHLKDCEKGFFGENNRFSIENSFSGSKKYSQELKKNKLYYYIDFSIADQPAELQDKLYLVDRDKYEFIPTSHVFHLISVEGDIYKCKDQKLAVSPIAIMHEPNTEDKIKSLTINYTDGSKKKMVDNESMEDCHITGHKRTNDSGNAYVYQCIFDKAIDTSKIKSIVLNGNEYVK